MANYMVEVYKTEIRIQTFYVEANTEAEARVKAVANAEAGEGDFVEEEKMVTLTANSREMWAILAGLRLYQAQKEGKLTADVTSEIYDISTNLGMCEPLNSDETEELINRLNETE